MTAHYHEQVKHQGKGLTINEIKWMLDPRNKQNCCISVLNAGNTEGQEEQPEADLPSEQVDQAPPFTSCALESFGPFCRKRGCNERWGRSFTRQCLLWTVANSLWDVSRRDLNVWWQSSNRQEQVEINDLTRGPENEKGGRRMWQEVYCCSQGLFKTTTTSFTE